MKCHSPEWAHYKGPYRHGFPSQNDKILCPSSEESCQFVCQDPFNIVRLFDFDTNPYWVDGWLNEDLFVLIASYMQWIQDDLRGGSVISRVAMNSNMYLASTSGILCRSTIWLEKFSRHNAAGKLARTQFRYGRSVFDYELVSNATERRIPCVPALEVWRLNATGNSLRWVTY